MWQRYFGGAADTLGQSIVLNGEGFTVVGVLPPDFVSLVRDAEIVVPYSPQTDPRRANRAQGFLRVIGRVKPGVTRAQVTDDLSAIGRRLRTEYPDSHDWSFFGETCDDEGQPSQVWLRHARSTPIKRHVKVKGDANPYDPAYETYFEQREGAHMQETFRGTRTLRFLWHEQSGLCTVCYTKITRITGWRLHHCVPRVMGGSHSTENRVLLHPECYDRVHNQRISVSKPRLPERGVRRA